ncbi:ABC transporter permease subunit [Marivirga atlantica]|uniref:ABC transporter permease n=1 Tax=Marivirga atlantica TaxID=1548457 RepID=UPI001F2672AE|nr:ABC transporter permease [Marivirga atlantica]
MKISEPMLLKNRGNIGILLFFGVIIMPFAIAFLYALLYSFGLVGILNDGFTIAYWLTVLSAPQLGYSFLYSALIAAVSVIFSVGLSLFTVLYLKKALNKPFINFMLYMPLAIPGIVSAFFTYQLFARTGFFSRLSYQLGIITEAASFPDLINDQFAFGIILTFISLLAPFFILFYLNLYKNENLEALERVAISLGANPKLATLKVSLPILLKKSQTVVLLYFIFLLGAYEVPLILGQESPQMLSVLILQELRQFDLNKIPEGYTMAVIYTSVVSLITFFIFRSQKNKVIHG